MKVTRLRRVTRDAWLSGLASDRNVLHLGCTDYPLTRDRIATGHLLHARLVEQASTCVGLDNDAEGIAILRSLMPGQEFIEADAEVLDEVGALVGRTFDCIVAADILEHLSNPGRFLSGVKPLLGTSGVLVVTTTQAFSVKRMLPMIVGREHVHPDHVAYFSVSTLTEIARRAGLVIDEFVGFQWINPTVRNRFAYLATLHALALSGNRLCDELGIVMSIGELQTSS